MLTNDQKTPKDTTVHTAAPAGALRNVALLMLLLLLLIPETLETTTESQRLHAPAAGESNCGVIVSRSTSLFEAGLLPSIGLGWRLGRTLQIRSPRTLIGLRRFRELAGPTKSGFTSTSGYAKRTGSLSRPPYTNWPRIRTRNPTNCRNEYGVQGWGGFVFEKVLFFPKPPPCDYRPEKYCASPQEPRNYTSTSPKSDKGSTQ